MTFICKHLWIYPLTLIWRGGYLAHQWWLKRQHIDPWPCPAMVIGSLRAGGGGRTSAVIAIACELDRLKIPYAILTYDLYAKSNRSWINVRQDSWKLCSDEAELIAKNCLGSVFCAQNRRQVAREIQYHCNAKILILDDGLEDPRLSGAVLIRLIQENEIEPQKTSDLIPLGLFRSLIQDHSNIDTQWHISTSTPSAFKIVQKPPQNHLGQILDKNHSFTLFSAIGNPKKFFESLQKMGYLHGYIEPCRDHDPYFSSKIAKLLMRNKTIVLSPKDWLKLSLDQQQESSIYLADYHLELNFSLKDFICNHPTLQECLK